MNTSRTARRVAEEGFSLIEHPADVGIEAWGPTLASAFEQSALGLMSLMFDPATVLPDRSREVRVTAADQEQLLVRWLSELLFLVDGEGFLPATCTIITLDPHHLLAVCRGDDLGLVNYFPRSEVKAITYHQLAVHSGPGGASVRVFLDI
jgi:SHS2 domain-containing protein